MRISLGLAGSIGVFAGHHDIVKLVGSSVWIEAPETSIIWSWKPLDYHGWGWDCAQRDQQQHTCQRWSWDLLSQKTLNDEKSTFALKNVKESAGGLFIDDLGMSDNRRYLARHAVTGEIVESYDLKVGKLPSFPTDLQCVTLAKNLKMTCEWDMGLQSFLPWAKSETHLFFKKVVNITGWSDAQLSKLSFTEDDELTECPKYCTEGNIGCCEFQLTREDMNDGDLRDRVTFLMKVTSQNEFGKATMKKANSEIISHSPTMNMKPLSPANLRAAPPNDYDGYSMIIKWDHDPGAMNSTMYQYRVEYKLQTDNSWQQSREVYLNELELNSMMLPYHNYEFRVKAKPGMTGMWSEPSETVTAKTAATQPTANLNAKYTILSYSNNLAKIKFFWLPYQQQNAPNNRFRIRIKTRKCQPDQEFLHDRVLYSTILSDPTVTSHEIELNVRNIPCLDVEFIVENDKGATAPQVEPIDLFRIDVNAPEIDIITGNDGHMIISPGELQDSIFSASINVCYNIPEIGETPICHKQQLTEDELSEKNGLVPAKAVLTPCYDYNVFLEGVMTKTNATVRSLPKAIRMDDYDMFIGNILSVRDVTRNEQTGVDLAVELTINWAVGDAINFVYGMHPAISWRNMADGKVHHKMVNLEKTLFYLNETDGIIGVSETAFWLSTCCNEDPDSCYAQTDEKVITISAGTPGVVRDLQIIWSKFEDAYFLHFVEPEQTNSPLRSYHVFLKYTDQSSGLRELIKSVPASSHEVSIKFDQVCKSVMDTVHVTVLAYGSDLKNGLIPGRPMLRTYNCADLIIEGLSTTIMASTLFLAVIMVALCSYIVFNRKQVKLYVQRTFWPKLEKPKFDFHHDSRDDFHYPAEKASLIEVEEITDIAVNILPEIPKTFPKSQDSTIDSGISGSEYSGGSGKSMPIYKLNGGIGQFPAFDSFRRESNATSGVHSGSDSGSGLESIHARSSNHSGDSLLSKGRRDSSAWNKIFPQTSDLSDYVGGEMIMSPALMGHYSVMDDKFGLQDRSSSPVPGQYISGYVGHSNFNFTNMPTVFLENFKKIKEISNSETLSYEYLPGLQTYDPYHRTSALFPNYKESVPISSSVEEHLPPGYTRANIFDLPTNPKTAFSDYTDYNDYNKIQSFMPPKDGVQILPPGYTRANIFDLPEDQPKSTPLPPRHVARPPVSRMNMSLDSDYITDGTCTMPHITQNMSTPPADGYVGESFLPSAFQKAQIRAPQQYQDDYRGVPQLGISADGYATESDMAMLSSMIPKHLAPAQFVPSHLISSDYTTSLDLRNIHIPRINSSAKRKKSLTPQPSGYVSIEGAADLHQFH